MLRQSHSCRGSASCTRIGSSGALETDCSTRLSNGETASLYISSQVLAAMGKPFWCLRLNQSSCSANSFGFAADVAERMRLGSKTIEYLKKRHQRGHLAPRRTQYTKPPKRNTP